jgi:hypothetical protein
MSVVFEMLNKCFHCVYVLDAGRRFEPAIDIRRKKTGMPDIPNFLNIKGSNTASQEKRDAEIIFFQPFPPELYPTSSVQHGLGVKQEKITAVRVICQTGKI